MYFNIIEDYFLSFICIWDIPLKEKLYSIFYVAFYIINFYKSAIFRTIAWREAHGTSSYCGRSDSDHNRASRGQDRFVRASIPEIYPDQSGSSRSQGSGNSTGARRWAQPSIASFYKLPELSMSKSRSKLFWESFVQWLKKLDSHFTRASKTFQTIRILYPFFSLCFVSLSDPVMKRSSHFFVEFHGIELGKKRCNNEAASQVPDRFKLSCGGKIIYRKQAAKQFGF